MSLASIDSNTWYSVQNYGSSNFLSWDGTSIPATMDIDNDPAPWQLLDSGIAQGGSSSNQYLLRSLNGGNSVCMQVENGGLVLDSCLLSSTSTLWTIVDPILNGQEAWVMSNSAGRYIQGPSSNGPPSLVQSGPTIDSGFGNFGWTLNALSQINDVTWSTLPWNADSNSGGGAATTSIQSSSPTPAAGSTTTPPATAVGTTTAGVSVPTGSAPVPSGEFFNFSYVDVNLKDLGPIGILAAKILLPAHTDIGCQNCSGSGYWDSQSGGYTQGSDEMDTLVEFLKNGYVNLTATDINLNMTLDYELEPGYTPVNTFLSLFNKNLTSVHISQNVRIDFILEIGIPFKIIVDSDVKFSAGMTLSIPGPANVNIDFGTFSDSSQSGFENSNIALVPFRMDDANLALTAISGLQFLLHCDVFVGLDDVLVNGNLTFEIDVPKLNATAQVESSPVNSNCGAPSGNQQTYSPAVELTFTADLDIIAQGNLTFKASRFPPITYHSDDWPAISYSRDVEPQCLFLDRLTDPIPSLDGKNAAGKNGTPRRWIWVSVLIGLLILFI